MNAKFMSSVIRFTPAKSSIAETSPRSSDAYWFALKNRVRMANRCPVPVCVLATHFAVCPVVSKAERAAHLECELCYIDVQFDVS